MEENHTNLSEPAAPEAPGASPAVATAISEPDAPTAASTATAPEAPEAPAPAEAGFIHLHVHTRYSILDGACEIGQLLKKAKDLNMNAMAITDHGNMYGVMEFVAKAKANGIKPIVGCEVYVAPKSRLEKLGREERSSYHLILLAKNAVGYHNLVKLCSLSQRKEAFYYKPRIDHELLEKYHEGLICCSACLAGEVPQAILSGQEELLKENIRFHQSLFGQDYYFEMQNHGHEEQAVVNARLEQLAAEYGIKCIASNDVHFVNADDYEAHRILICLNTGKKINEDTKLLYTGQEYLKSAGEMAALFPGHPEYLENTREIVDKIEEFELEHAPLMPHFPLPEPFTSDMDYLRHLTYEGAKKRYGENFRENETLRERIDFELSTIEGMGFPGYFLIVWDFIRAAREMGVLVGPGRGSAAGSALAYCLGITNIDPIKYDLLFERFLNPARISLPDIDVDFDDVGREKVIKYVVDKYGSERVSQIITYGSMAAKSAIKDVARVLDLPLPESNRLAKLVPDTPGVNLNKDFKTFADLKKKPSLSEEEKEKLGKVQYVALLQEEMENSPDPLVRDTIRFALKLEGCIRSVGVHACGMIIAPEDIIEYVPTGVAKDSEMPVTQYEGAYVESVGLIKMDFLGLRTLTIIKDALDNIKLRHGIDIDIEAIPLDDKLTYDLFSRGDTNGIFQFESDGMKKYMRELKPNRLEDIIAMNALYRPGPMDYIPQFIRRKEGSEEIKYDLPEMEEYLKDTYGVTVYQEQVMLLSQKLAGFTKGDADTLRKAMGKKKKDVLDKMKTKFMDGCEEHRLDRKTCDKIWTDWEAFASYAFNKSHATCYAWIAYQTAYLKAHYPAEFMAAVLTNNLNAIEKISFYMEECRRMKIDLLGPDINESQANFTVNAAGAIRFGLCAVKNVGANVVETLVAEREATGPFENIFDFVKRGSFKNLNKRCMESLVKAGAFDSFGTPIRSAYFHQRPHDDRNFIDQLIQYASQYQKNLASAQTSLFGEFEAAEDNNSGVGFDIPEVEPWSMIEQAKNEKEVTGFYISDHPLNQYKFEIEQLTTVSVAQLKTLPPNWANRTLRFGFMVTNAFHGTTKTGKPYGKITIEDFDDSYEWAFFGEPYLKFKHLFNVGDFLFAQAVVKPRWGRDMDNLEVSATNMMPLSDALDYFAKSVEIDLGLSYITPSLTQTLQELLKKHLVKSKKETSEGASVQFRVRSEGLTLNMPVKAGRVRVSDFVQALREADLSGLDYKVKK